MKRTQRRWTIVALALLAGSANVPARATAVRQKPGAQPSQRTAADGRVSLRDGAVVTRVIDAGSGAPISGALVGETRTSFTISASGYRPLEIALGHDAVARGDRRAEELPAIALCELGASDKDGDGLCDAAERQYRSDPSSTDTDGDSISDYVEMYGAKRDDGSMFDLKAQGATPDHKDVFVHMDWTTADNKPSQEAVDLVVKAYANAPLKQLDGKMGISLHVEFGKQIEVDGDIALTPEAQQSIRKANFKNDVQSFPFHYAILADWLVGHDASGYSPEIPGKNFVVAVQGIGRLTARRLGGTLMHELGHNLGLLHGGNQWKNNKPNYISVMNYLYQFDGIQYEPGNRAKRELDYARFTTIAINEWALNERNGFRPTTTSGTAPDRTVYDPSINICLPRSRRTDCTRAMSGQVPGTIDYNRNGRIDPLVVRDLNGNRLLEPFRAGINDWAVLKFHGIPNPANRSRIVSDDEDEDLPCPLPTDDSDVPGDDDPSHDGSLDQDTSTTQPSTGTTTSSTGTGTASQPGTASTPSKPGTTSTTSNPGSSTAPKPGSSTAPKPGSSTAPKPGSSTAPKPGSSTAPKPGSSTAPKPGSGTAPKPGSSTAPKPGTTPSSGGTEGPGEEPPPDGEGPQTEGPGEEPPPDGEGPQTGFPGEEPPPDGEGPQTEGPGEEPPPDGEGPQTEGPGDEPPPDGEGPGTSDDPGAEPPPDGEGPMSEDPGQEPWSEEPGIGDPGTDDPGTDDPGTDDPGTDDPADEVPVF